MIETLAKGLFYALVMSPYPNSRREVRLGQELFKFLSERGGSR